MKKEGDQVRSGLLADYETDPSIYVISFGLVYEEQSKNFNCSPSTLLPYEVVPYLDFGLFQMNRIYYF